MHEQTAQVQINLLTEKQSDQGLCCLPFNQYITDISTGSQMNLFKF